MQFEIERTKGAYMQFEIVAVAQLCDLGVDFNHTGAPVPWQSSQY